MAPSRQAQIAAICVIGARRMFAPHASRRWALQTIDGPTTGCDTRPVPEVAKNNSGFPGVPDFTHIFSEMRILLRLNRPLADQRFVVSDELV
jgi:hypothetical protein